MLDYLLVWNADQWVDVRGSVRSCSEVEHLRRPRILHPCRHLAELGWVTVRVTRERILTLGPNWPDDT